MKKEISVIRPDGGKDCVVNGHVEVKLETENVAGHNPSTHEDTVRTIQCHSVTGFANGIGIFYRKTMSRDSLLKAIDEATAFVTHQLRVMPIHEDDRSLEEILTAKGFK